MTKYSYTWLENRWDLKYGRFILKNLQSEQNFDNQQNVEPDHIQSSDESEKSNFSTETNDSIESKIAKIATFIIMYENI